MRLSAIIQDEMSDIKDLTDKVVKFRDERNWKQFHNPKDIAISLSLEASELLEHFQWKSEGEIKKYIVTNRKQIGEEISDVLYWVILLSHDLKLDIKTIFNRKMIKNNKNYPVKKSS